MRGCRLASLLLRGNEPNRLAPATQTPLKKWILTWLFVFSSTLSLLCPPQILIELETALLDDIPHWYKLQTHDVSSIPLPQPSPYLPRRHVHGDSPSKKLQSMSSGCMGYCYRLCVYKSVYVRFNPCFVNLQCVCECVIANLSFTELSLLCLSVWETDNRTSQPYPVLYVCVVYVRVQGLIASLIQSLMMVWW